jgi:methylthioribose-1-phosphate isomerase
MEDGSKIPIEERSGEEITKVTGMSENGRLETVEIAAPGTRTVNYGFDVTPARLVTGLITERGIIAANREAIRRAFADRF